MQDLAKEIQSFGAGCPISVDPSGITAAYSWRSLQWASACSA